jgi:hypothetical protein
LTINEDVEGDAVVLAVQQVVHKGRQLVSA